MVIAAAGREDSFAGQTFRLSSGNGTLVGLTKVIIGASFCAKVVRLSAKPWSYLILAGSLLIILLVQVLPSVDLPDTVFQRDSEPVEIKTRSTATPALLVAALLPSLFFAAKVFRCERAPSSAKPERKPILILEHILRC